MPARSDSVRPPLDQLRHTSSSMGWRSPVPSAFSTTHPPHRGASYATCVPSGDHVGGPSTFAAEQLSLPKTSTGFEPSGDTVHTSETGFPASDDSGRTPESK